MDVKIGQGLRENYYGPEIGIADYLSNNDSDSKKTFLIKYAAGGTGFRIDEYNWRSPSTGAPGSLYNEFIVFINNNLANLVNLGYQPVIKSLIWMQGEDDANNLDSANLYYSRLTSFVSDVFNTFASYAPEGNVNNMSFVDGLIYQGESSAWPFSKELNEVKKSIAASNPNYHYLDTTETGLNLKINGEGGDPYHYDVGSMLKLGKGFGEILLDEGII